MSDIFFCSLAIISALLAIACVTTAHLLRSAVYLMGVLTLTAGLYILLGSEFLAGIQVLVYVGGVVVLLVFAIMMTKTEAIRDDSASLVRHLVALFTATAFFASNVYFVIHSLPSLSKATIDPLKSDVALFGRAFLNTGSEGYVLPFELISLLLLAVLIGGIVISREAKTKAVVK